MHIKCNFFGETGTELIPGDIVYMNSAYATTYKGQLILYQGKKGVVYRIGHYYSHFDEKIKMSDYPNKN